ncbi:MAG: hypothetical protein H0V92_04940 [Pseudonocardiales bacterium]|nr:hypothetical protein [Pseudonocardiales bacterium]
MRPYRGILLGARLLWYCIRLMRERSITPVAWQMYRYSLVYLALLFLAMGIDRALPFGRRPEAHRVIILGRPGQEIAIPAAVDIHH